MDKQKISFFIALAIFESLINFSYAQIATKQTGIPNAQVASTQTGTPNAQVASTQTGTPNAQTKQNIKQEYLKTASFNEKLTELCNHFDKIKGKLVYAKENPDFNKYMGLACQHVIRNK